MRLRTRAHCRLATPARGGPPPRVAFSPLFLAVALALTVLAPACSNGSADQVTTPISIGMTSGVTPYYADGQITLYQVNASVAFPVRKPSSSDERALGPAPKGTPYPHAPFLLASDESVEVHYVISNVDSIPHSVWLLVDPWNEFVRWKPGVTIVSDEETIPNNGYDKQYVVAPKSRIEGTITPDDVHEIAIKLASVENFLASSQAKPTSTPGDGPTPTEICNNIFDYQNRSNSSPADPFYTPWIPPVVAGLTGFDLGLRMEVDGAVSTPVTTPDGGSSGAAGNVAIEITMEIQDLNGNRFVPQDTTQAQMGPPSQALSPPAARF